ncbi:MULTISPECIES: barstar family protein [unclassified Sphingomonas]|jgi:Barstar (barnase inhibitor)|uniref:barstar family protein n=4 Tax=Pseudomonadota TaxID=1224 RepID=UPI000AFCDFD7|nr:MULTISPECIES: barstar family protein [unclassified Sphingomonas]
MFAEGDRHDRADWPLLQNGAVNLFHSPEILADACADLAALGYALAEISCRDGSPGFERQFADLLRWQDQFGYLPWSGNLDALNDAMAGYPFGSSGKSALVLDGFHLIADADRDRAHALLDIFESASRDHLLFGHILVVLVQTDDATYACPGIGGRSANWNAREAARRRR